MAYEPPAQLVQLKRDFLAAEERRREVGQAMPAPTAVAAGEATITEDQREAWQAACAESARLAEAIHRDDWWGTVDNRHSADMALLEAAKG